MASLTRWVLNHKRTVVIFWVALTLVGMLVSDLLLALLDPRIRFT